MPREVRADFYRDKAYTPPGELELPPGMEKAYRDKGYHLRWIRAEINGQDDSRNIAKRIREGYQLMQKSELDEEWREHFETRKVRNNNQVICVGDLVLGKIELDKAANRQKYYEDQSTLTVSQAKSIARDGGQAPNPKLDRLTPLQDDSSTVVKVGNNAQTQD